MSREKIHHEEERAPCGERGALEPVSWMHCHPRPDLRDCLAIRIDGLQNSIIVWEPLPTKAPGPHLTRPWCCYICTVIFYRTPYLTLPPKPWRDREGKLHRGTTGSFFEWDRVETRLNHHTLVAFDGAQWQSGSGRVIWAGRRWWMRHWLRRYVPKHQALRAVG